MSKLPLAPIFSAAHISKWESLPEEILIRVTQPRREPEGTTRTLVEDGALAHDTSASTRETARAAPINVADESRDMAVRTHTWITLWFLLTLPLIIWDATYCFFRPRSMVGGDLHWIWEPYGIYQSVDYVYGLKTLEENSGFPNAQSLLNLIETALNVAYVYLAHVSGWPGAPLIGFAAATMTFSKTVLYMAQEYYCGGCAVGHNTLGDFLLYYVLLNGLWILFPGMIVWRLGDDIIDALSVASQSARRAASGKTQ